MNEYVRPDYEVMVFEANEYVAACPWIPNETILGLNCTFGGTTEVTIGSNSGSKMPDDLYFWNVTYLTSDNVQGSGSLLPVFEKTGDDQNPNTNTTDEFTFTGKYGFTGIISDKGHTTDTQAGEHTPWSSSSNPNGTYYLGSGYNEPQNGNGGYTWWSASTFHLVDSIINMSKNVS